MKLSEQPVIFREALMVFHALRSLGFSADDIYFHIGAERVDLSELRAAEQVTGKPAMGIATERQSSGYQTCVVLRTQGTEYIVVIGVIDDTVDNISDKWRALCDALNSDTLDKSELEHYWINSAVFRNGHQLVATILMKGIHLPCVADAGFSAVDTKSLLKKTLN